METGKYYVNYGGDLKKESDPKIGISNIVNKPYGKDVTWACRIFRKMHYSWLDWCYSEGFHLDIYRPETRRIFKLSDNANILVLNGRSGIKKLLDNPDLLKENEERIYPFSPYDLFINWDYVIAHYDGLELIHGDAYNEYHYSAFNSWDVDSIVVWNQDMLLEIEKHLLPRWARRNINRMEKRGT